MATPSRKRQKVALACDQCRSRKIKCDGHMPDCGPCLRRPGRTVNLQCSWSKSPNQSIQHLQAELDGLKQLQQSGQLGHANLTDTREPIHGSQPTRTTHFGAGSRNAAHPDGQYKFSGGIRQESTLDRDEIPIHQQTEIPFVGKEESRVFLGASSTRSFMESISSIFRQRVSDGPNVNHPYHPERPGKDWIPERQDFERDQLPLRQTADRLMHLYYFYVHPLFPFLDVEQMETDYDRLWSGKDLIQDQFATLCTINAIFALMTQVDSTVDPARRQSVAATYFNRSLALYSPWRPSSTEWLQALLIMSLYCQSCNAAHQYWTLVGMSIRMAQELGLHLGSTSTRAPDRRLGERLRRMWHTCVTLDRQLALQYGRPCAVSAQDAERVPLAASMSIDQTANHSQPDSRLAQTINCSVEFFNNFVKLTNIGEGILSLLESLGVAQAHSLSELYDNHVRMSTSDQNKQRTILDLERDLHFWLEELPLSLKMPEQNDTDNHTEYDVSPNPQSIMLRQFYLHIHMLLLRPVLSAVVSYETSPGKISKDAAPSIATGICIQLATACVSDALKSVEVLYKHKPATPGMVGNVSAWWCNILFLYSAATVMIAGCLVPAVETTLTGIAIKTSWKKSLDMLAEYAVFEPSCTHLVAVLRVLYETIPKQYSQSTADGKNCEAQGYESMAGQSGPTAKSTQPIDDLLLDLGNIDDLLETTDFSWLTNVPFEL